MERGTSASSPDAGGPLNLVWKCGHLGTPYMSQHELWLLGQLHLPAPGLHIIDSLHPQWSPLPLGGRSKEEVVRAVPAGGGAGWAGTMSPGFVGVSMAERRGPWKAPNARLGDPGLNPLLPCALHGLGLITCLPQGSLAGGLCPLWRFLPLRLECLLRPGSPPPLYSGLRTEPACAQRGSPRKGGSRAGMWPPPFSQLYGDHLAGLRTNHCPAAWEDRTTGRQLTAFAVWGQCYFLLSPQV